jgi:hypothetical protein
MSFGLPIWTLLERIVYVIAGLPIAVHGSSVAPSPEARIIRRAFAHRYWRPDSLRDAAALFLGLLLTPLAVPFAALWFTLRNGPIIKRREGKGLLAQFVEQLRLYDLSGVVGPWYYIFSLHRDGARRAPTFLQRCETKRGVYGLLKDKSGVTAIGNKLAFAQRCAAAGVPCVACEMVIDRSELDPSRLPDCDLFVKPLTGCGGRGAERWDRIGLRSWSNGEQELGDRELVDRLRSKGEKLVVQRRIRPHPKLVPLTSGALPTVRALTILDEDGWPEIIAAVFRMSIGKNRTVDNIHAGGLACAVSLSEGVLGLASNLGSDARLGWHSHHPTTGAPIQGKRLPFWSEVKALAERAHDIVDGRLALGWDIAITEQGPIIIEGNRGPDMDLMQRFMDVGFCQHHRFGELIAHHLRARGYGKTLVSVPDATQPSGARDAAGTSAR